MRPRQLDFAIRAVCILVLQVVAAVAAPAATSDQETIQLLQKQVDDLTSELARLKGATDATARQQATQQHWSMMQEHMRTMRMMPGMGAKGCSDWMMMDPNLMGRGMMGSGAMGPGGSTGCGWTGHGMMGPGMGQGMGWWGMPSSMTPDVYQRQMQDHMQRMHKEMAAISAEKDPAKRQALIREHYQGMYRDMQTMRGMGWMWAPNAAASLPEAKSQGAQLVAKYCSQCHAAPSPSIHTKEEWSQVTSRMSGHIDQQANSAWANVQVPSASDLDTIGQYLGKHAKAGN